MYIPTVVCSLSRRTGGTLKLINVPARIHAQFRTTRLLSVFDLFEAEAEALQSFGDNP